MRLASESMLSYQGLHGMDGLMHGRVYGEAGHIPVVIAGQPDDNPGTLLAIGIEMAAASIQENLFADGREVRLVSEPRDTLGNSWFRQIEFQHRHISEDARDPSHYTAAIMFVNDAGDSWRLPPVRKARRLPRPGLEPP